MTIITEINDITEHPVAPAANQTPDRGHRAAYGYVSLHTDNQFTDGHIWPLFRFVYVFPDATFCYQAHSYERCHSDVDHTLWPINYLPEEEPCHRITQEKFHLNIINTKCLSINRPSPSAVC